MAQSAPAKEKQQTSPVGEWHHFDASKIVLGRLSTQVAHLLLGKHRPDFAPNIVAPVYVVVTNTDKLRVTGDKLAQKRYYRYSGYPGGIRSRTLEDQLQRDSRRVIIDAVYGMLPKNSLRDERMKHLKVYADADHPHTDVIPQS